MTDRVRRTLPLALLASSALAAAPVAAQARAASSANYTCEGTAAQVVSNSWTGEQRSEWQISFGMNINRGAGSVMLYRVSGTSVIKPGRHAIAADSQGRMAIAWDWTDQANRSQTVTMTVSRSGEFAGAWSQSPPPFGDMFKMTIRGSFSGVCWQ